METASSGSAGFLRSFRALGDSLLAMVQDRLELVSVELQEEKFRLIQIFIWISAAIFTAMMAVTFASLTLVYLFWSSARLAVLGGLTALYVGALVVIMIAFRRYLARQPNPFCGDVARDPGRSRMYPNRELSRLAVHKAALRRNIAFHRIQCAGAAARVAAPFEWIDRMLELWRRIRPIAAVPLTLLFTRVFFHRIKILRPLLRWGPVVFGIVRGLRSAGTAARSAKAARR